MDDIKTSKRLVIFDADSIIFTIAYRYRDKKAKHLATMNLNKYISEIIANCAGTHYIGFYGSKEDGAEENFRYNIYDKYKANRKETPEWVHKWRPTLHSEMKNKWSFMPIEGMEADDAASIAANYYRDSGEFSEVIIATEDKDLKQVPGITYYNSKKHTSEYITPFEGHRFLAAQTLQGDPTDNIPGLPGIGPKTAEKLVATCTSVLELKKVVISAYKTAFNDLLTKLQASCNVVSEDELKAKYAAKGMTLSPRQLQRKLKMANKGAGDEIYNTFPGGWKNYLKMNFALVRMLVRTNEAPPSFVLPEPVETDIKSKDRRTKSPSTVEDARSVLFGDAAQKPNTVKAPEITEIGTFDVITGTSNSIMSL
jgi:5'-3' exonuclease